MTLTWNNPSERPSHFIYKTWVHLSDPVLAFRRATWETFIARGEKLTFDVLSSWWKSYVPHKAAIFLERASTVSTMVTRLLGQTTSVWWHKLTFFPTVPMWQLFLKEKWTIQFALWLCCSQGNMNMRQRKFSGALPGSFPDPFPHQMKEEQCKIQFLIQAIHHITSPH